MTRQDTLFRYKKGGINPPFLLVSLIFREEEPGIQD